MRDYETSKDEQLFAWYAGGDAAAFRHLQFRHQRRLQAKAGINMPAGHREEVVQDVFVALHTAAVAGTPITSVRAWCNGVLARKVADFWRGAQGKQLMEERRGVSLDDTPLPVSSGGDGATAADDRMALEQGLEALSREHRQVVWLAFFQGYSAAEVQAATGMTPNNVYKIVERFKRALREALGDNS